MPELPEVETTRRGISPHLTGRRILELVLRVPRLRNPLESVWCEELSGQTIRRVERRAKYLLLSCSRGTLIIHLGMSGVLRVVAAGTTERKHDHIDLILTDGNCLRFSDPRRFGVFLYTRDDPYQHPLLADLGPEPLGETFSAAELYRVSRRRTLAVKSFIMDQRTVVGVGNIYASEALFRARIHPARPAGTISLQRYRRLVTAIREILNEALSAGGTTINDFRNQDGRPGYFRQCLQVYQRGGEPCPQCGRTLLEQRIGQRSSYFCGRCQK